jgi:hypothetical protein
MSRPAGQTIAILSITTAPGSSDWAQYYLTSNAKMFPVGLLQACRDSRSTALGWYRLMLLRGSLTHAIFFDVERDALRFLDEISFSLCYHLRNKCLPMLPGAFVDHRTTIQRLEITEQASTTHTFNIMGHWTALETIVCEEACDWKGLSDSHLQRLKVNMKAYLERKWKSCKEMLAVDTTKMPTITWVKKTSATSYG